MRYALVTMASALAGCTFGDPADPGPVPKPEQIVLCAGSGPYMPQLENQYDHVPGTPYARVVYNAWFPGGALDCGYMDRIHSSPLAMKGGDAQVPGTADINIGPAASGALMLSFTAPKPIPKDITTKEDLTPSVGVFSTDLSLGRDEVFLIQATFRAPTGPHLAPKGQDTNAWAVTIAARTGTEADLGKEERLGVTFKTKENSATLNVQETGASGPLNSIPIPKDIYDRIFGTGGGTPQPFTLSMFVNRSAGTGVASLVPAYPALQIPFNMHHFGPQTGPIITAAGATLANCCSPGEPVSVEVSDFRISQYYGRGGFPRFEPNVPNPPPIDPLRDPIKSH